MTRKLRIRFIFFSMLALVIMQACIIFFTSYRSYTKMTATADAIASAIYEAYPQPTDVETRYFVVVADAEGEITDINLSHIISVRRKGADAYMKAVLKSNTDAGFRDDFRYRVFTNADCTKIAVFLARGGNLDALKSNVLTLSLFSLCGLGVMFLLLIASSFSLTRPIRIAEAKQKEFITSASHEIKTPLTVIRADADMLETQMPNNEWIKDIRFQAKRLTDMSVSMTSLARLEEQSHPITKITFPISDIAEDVARPFSALAMSNGKQFATNIRGNISYYGDENLIRQLFMILLDNAIKYCPRHGEILFGISKTSGKNSVIITVTNNSEPMTEDELSRIFDRFYRTKHTASSKQAKGFGLGLSIAKGIVKGHNGKIAAKALRADLVQITAVLR